MLQLAALLHDADDHKYFPKESGNGKRIIQECIEEVEGFQNDDDSSRMLQDSLMCIDFVSASQNGNRVPEIAVQHPELLWPRFCDRLEAIGIIGAVRCYQVTCERNGPLHIQDSTPRPQNEEELWNMVDPQRFVEYQKEGKSNSMMDHYYDKLLQIAKYVLM